MPTIREEMAADIANAIVIYGQSFEWNGSTYACVRRDEPTALELQEDGGFRDGVSAALVVAKSAFAGYNPADTTTFPYFDSLVNNSAHQVKHIRGHKDPAAAQLILYIGSID